MAGLIVKSPYIKGGGAGGYLRYIATRERVEILPDGRPPTRKQEQLIAKLTKDFSDVKELSEYADYAERPTKANASVLITKALEEHWEDVRASSASAPRPASERPSRSIKEAVPVMHTRTPAKGGRKVDFISRAAVSPTTMMAGEPMAASRALSSMIPRVPRTHRSWGRVPLSITAAGVSAGFPAFKSPSTMG